MADENQNHPGYEHKDVSATKIIIISIIGIVLTIAAVAFVVEVFIITSEKMIAEITLGPQAAAIRELRARETKQLTSYEVLNADAGTYQIPIERAIQLLADEAYREKIK